MSQSKCFVKNYMEDIVWSFLPNVLEKYPEMCHCACCQHDIVAIALNHLKPAYVARTMGEVYTKINILETQHRTDVYSALTKAVMIVSENPRHPAEEE
ncbi:MAG: late competence development ComFB family protein [Bacillota bacterium]